LHPYESYSDKELFIRISESDETAFEQIFHTYNKKLFPVVRSITKSEAAAEEIVQEVFLRLWLHRAALKQINEPAAWLVRIASNLSLTWLKRSVTYAKLLKQVEAEMPVEVINPGSVMDAEKMAALVAGIVTLLPEKRRKIYCLSREMGLSRQEIAHLLQVSESTVKNQLTASLKFIQRHITAASTYLQLFFFIFLKRFL